MALRANHRRRIEERRSAEHGMTSSRPERVYLDHAATTRPDARVIEAMLPWLRDHWHNPSSIYVEAQEARRAIDGARETVAELLGARPEEIVFTSGGSESDNLALRGVMAASRARGRHLVTTAVEHHAVLDTAEELEREGTEVTRVGVDGEGRTSATEVAAAVR